MSDITNAVEAVQKAFCDAEHDEHQSLVNDLCDELDARGVKDKAVVIFLAERDMRDADKVKFEIEHASLGMIKRINDGRYRTVVRWLVRLFAFKHAGVMQNELA